MRLAIIDQTGDVAGGAQESLELFLRNIPADIEPTVIFFKDGVFAERVRRLGISTTIVAIDEELQRVKRERFPLAALKRLPRTLRTIRAALRAASPDVVYTNGIKAHMLGSLSARSLGVPAVVHHRDILGGAARLALILTIAVSTTSRIATSRNVARAYPLPKTFVIDNPVDLDAYRLLPDRRETRAILDLPLDETVAAVIGRINRWKGIDRFIRAVAKVNETVPLRALIVGAPVFRDSDLLLELQAQCAELHLGDLVTFAGWADDTRAIYAAIDVNVNASRREPFGRTIIEAAACGVPSVCFDDSGVSETMIAGVTGLVLDSNDETALAKALTHYATDADARNAAGAASRVWSKRFDARQHVLSVSNVLRAAVTKRR